MFARFFVDRPVFATVLSRGDHHRGPGRLREAAGRPVSGDRPADHVRHRQLPRRQRQGRRRHRRRADRAGSQRRRKHDLHVVAEHQRRPDDPRRHLQAGDQSGPGPGAGAEPRGRRRGQAARRGEAPGRDHEEEVPEHPPLHQPALREGDGPRDRQGPIHLTTSCTSATTRPSTSRTSWPASPASATSSSLARATTACASGWTRRSWRPAT